MVYLDQSLHTKCMSTLSNCITTGVRNILFFIDEALLSSSQASLAQLVKMLIHVPLEPHVYLDQILQFYLFQHCPSTGMQNGVEALLSIISVG